MPWRLRVGPYRIGFYAADRHEPPHVHVKRERWQAKVWLGPSPRLADDGGFSAREAREIVRIVQAHHAVLMRQWHEFFGV